MAATSFSGTMCFKVIIIFALSFFAVVVEAETRLYETGPAQDASFVRFLNTVDESLTIANGSARVVLGTQDEKRASRFYPVRAGAKLSAIVHFGHNNLAVAVTAKPSEFITIAVISKGNALESMLLRESPNDFNAMRASIALLNADPTCAVASLIGGAKATSLFDGIKPSSIQRRLVNPVRLAVQVECGGRSVGKPIDMGQLEAGERYSIILVNGKNGRHAFFMRDSII